MYMKMHFAMVECLIFTKFFVTLRSEYYYILERKVSEQKWR